MVVSRLLLFGLPEKLVGEGTWVWIPFLCFLTTTWDWMWSTVISSQLPSYAVYVLCVCCAGRHHGYSIVAIQCSMPFTNVKCGYITEHNTVMDGWCSVAMDAAQIFVAMASLFLCFHLCCFDCTGLQLHYSDTVQVLADSFIVNP